MHVISYFKGHRMSRDDNLMGTFPYWRFQKYELMMNGDVINVCSWERLSRWKLYALIYVQDIKNGVVVTKRKRLSYKYHEWLSLRLRLTKLLWRDAYCFGGTQRNCEKYIDEENRWGCLRLRYAEIYWVVLELHILPACLQLNRGFWDALHNEDLTSHGVLIYWSLSHCDENSFDNGLLVNYLLRMNSASGANCCMMSVESHCYITYVLQLRYVWSLYTDRDIAYSGLGRNSEKVYYFNYEIL